LTITALLTHALGCLITFLLHHCVGSFGIAIIDPDYTLTASTRDE
jgi:hypothetical protein